MSPLSRPPNGARVPGHKACTNHCARGSVAGMLVEITVVDLERLVSDAGAQATSSVVAQLPTAEASHRGATRSRRDRTAKRRTQWVHIRWLT